MVEARWGGGVVVWGGEGMGLGGGVRCSSGVWRASVWRAGGRGRCGVGGSSSGLMWSAVWRVLAGGEVWIEV